MDHDMGNLLFLTGMLPVVDHKPKYLGRLGKELDANAGRVRCLYGGIRRSGCSQAVLGLYLTCVTARGASRRILWRPLGRLF